MISLYNECHCSTTGKISRSGPKIRTTSTGRRRNSAHSSSHGFSSKHAAKSRTREPSHSSIHLSIHPSYYPSSLLPSLTSHHTYFLNILSPPITPTPFPPNPFLSPPTAPNFPLQLPPPYSGVEPESRLLLRSKTRFLAARALATVLLVLVVVVVVAGSKAAVRRMRASKLTRRTGRGETISETGDCGFGLLVRRTTGSYWGGRR